MAHIFKIKLQQGNSQPEEELKSVLVFLQIDSDLVDRQPTFDSFRITLGHALLKDFRESYGLSRSFNVVREYLRNIDSVSDSSSFRAFALADYQAQNDISLSSGDHLTSLRVVQYILALTNEQLEGLMEKVITKFDILNSLDSELNENLNLNSVLIHYSMVN